MKRIKVFISSIIENYQDKREALREVLIALDQEDFGLQPIMVEKDYPARPRTPQQVCLEGVEESQIFVGIYGGKYGDITATGLSPTHEEYQKAKHLEKLCLAFVEKNVLCEPRQEEFLKDVREWVTGAFWKEFQDIGELKYEADRAFRGLQKENILKTLRPPAKRRKRPDLYLKDANLVIEEWVEQVEILTEGNVFLSHLIKVKKLKQTESEDRLFLGTLDSPYQAFAKEDLALQIISEEGKSLTPEWLEDTAYKKRFDIMLGKILRPGETLSFRYNVFLPKAFNLDLPKEYWDEEISHPVENVIEHIWLPAKKQVRNIRVQYVSGDPVGEELEHRVYFSLDSYRNRPMITWVMKRPELRRYELWWDW